MLTSHWRKSHVGDEKDMRLPPKYMSSRMSIHDKEVD